MKKEIANTKETIISDTQYAKTHKDVKSLSGNIQPDVQSLAKSIFETKSILPASDRPMSAKLAYLKNDSSVTLKYKGAGSYIIALCEKYNGNLDKINEQAIALEKRKAFKTNNLKSLVYRRYKEFCLIEQTAALINCNVQYDTEGASV